MPEGWKQAIKGFNAKMDEHLASLDDFAAAIEEGGYADEIVDNWQARTLLRQLPPDAPEQ